MDLVKNTVEYREEKNVCRKDFFQLLIQLRNSGQIQKDDEWNIQIRNKGIPDLICIQDIGILVFFFAQKANS